MKSVESRLPRSPIPNCYRVPDSRIIAGEYPGDRDTTRARDKINALLHAGVEGFIDLTSQRRRLERESSANSTTICSDLSNKSDRFIPST